MNVQLRHMVLVQRITELVNGCIYGHSAFGHGNYARLCPTCEQLLDDYINEAMLNELVLHDITPTWRKVADVLFSMLLIAVATWVLVHLVRLWFAS